MGEDGLKNKFTAPTPPKSCTIHHYNHHNGEETKYYPRQHFCKHALTSISAVSKHSRAARRATSPSIDLDKSLKDLKPPPRHTSAVSAANDRPSVLAVHRSAGVQKKARVGRKSQMSARARRRHEKGLEMAEAIAERTSTKLQRSLGRERTVKDRSKAWEQINRLAEEQDELERKAAEGEQWETEEEMDDDGDVVVEEASPSAPVPVSAMKDDDNDIIL